MTGFDPWPRGRRIGERFVVEQLLGQGRSSAVYRALDLRSHSHVALKVLDPFLADDPVNRERFAREVQIIRSLDHPNIVRLYSFFQEGDFHVICMEYIEGLDGAAYLDRNGPLAVAELLALAKTMAAAVDSCHRAKVLHRDLKPQNILLTRNQEVKLVDFGISKVNTMSDLTKTGTVIGTPEYMAPEQFRSTLADPRSDVYSLGAVFYQLLTGRVPYAGASLSRIMSRQLSEEIEPIASSRDDVPAWLEAVVFKCLRTDPGRRYQSCYELLSDLEKGERSLARYEAKRQDVQCLSCQAERIAGLPFCHHCGTFSSDLFERGNHALILYQCDHPDAVCGHLARVFQLGERALRSRLKRLPLLLLRGVSQSTAAAVAGDLAPYPCELAITDKLPRHFRLPHRYVVYACLALSPILLFRSSLTAALVLLMILAAEGLVLSLYLRKTRPLIKLPALRRRSKTPADPFVLEAAKQLRRLSTGDLKRVLGNLVRSFLALRRSTCPAAAGLDRGALERLMEQAWLAAEAIESYELYLSSRSLNDIKQKLDTAELKLGHAKDASHMAPLIDLKAKLQADFKRYQEVQELHSRLFVGLLNLNSTVRALEDALAEQRQAPDLNAQLAGLDEDLQVHADSVTGKDLRAAALPSNCTL